jgi:hypothetical protein
MFSKRSLPIGVFCPGFYLEGLRKGTKEVPVAVFVQRTKVRMHFIRSASVLRDLNHMETLCRRDQSYWQ